MKLERVPNAPEWLRRDPASGFYWVDIYRAKQKPRRLSRSTHEKLSRRRAIAIGERMVSAWLGQDPATGEKRQYRFSEVARDCLALHERRFKDGKIRLGTITNAREFIPRLSEDFGDIPIQELTEADWNVYVARFREESPGKTLTNQWKHMNLVMSYAFKNGYIRRQWKVENPDPRKETGRVLTEVEKTTLLAVAPRDLKDQFLFAMTMGMRLREHLYLTWDRVDLKTKTVTLRPSDTKTNKGRVIRMSPQVYAMLLRRYEKLAHRSPFVFPSRLRLDRATHQNKTAWRTAKRKAKILGKCRYHDLRHTFLSECAKLVREGTVSIAQVCRYAGLGIQVFERVYLKLKPEDTEVVATLIAVNLREQEAAAEVTH